MSESAIFHDNDETPVDVLYVPDDIASNSSSADVSETSLITTFSKRKRLHDEALDSPGSEILCSRYIALSDSEVLRHPYYAYPGLTDPGIKEALLSAEPPIIYSNDGQMLYLQQCSKNNLCPVRIFHKGLLNSEINLAYYGVNPRGVRAMAKALEYNRFVTRFDLSSNFLDDDACYHLGQMLEVNTYLQELILKDCRIGVSGLLRLGDCLSTNRTLITLDISGNDLKNEGAEYFVEIVKGSYLERINLSNNGIDQAGAVALVNIMGPNCKFTHLDLSWNQFSHVSSTRSLITAMAGNKFLQEVNLSHSTLDGQGINTLLRAPLLQYLDLSNNNIQSTVINVIAKNLKLAKKLKTLDLSNNPVQPEDADRILNAMLKRAVKIDTLVLENIHVYKSFLQILDEVKSKKFRANFKVTYGKVLKNWTVTGPDARYLLFKRADYLGRSIKKNPIDVGVYFLLLKKELPSVVMISDFQDRLKADKIPVVLCNVFESLPDAFPGPRMPKGRTINISKLAEYVPYLWPDKRLPPTLEPEPEPEPEPVPKKAAKKGKK